MPDTDSWLRRTVEQHDRDLYRGNGLPGITTRIKSLEDCLDGTDISRLAIDLSKLEGRVSQMENTIKEFKSGQTWIIRLLLGGLILAALNLVIPHH